MEDWMDLLEFGGGLGDAGGGTEAQTASARTVVPTCQKILDFYMKFT